MKKLLISLVFVSVLASAQSLAATTRNTVACNTASDYDTLANAFVNDDKRMIDHLSDTGKCYILNDGLEYSKLGSTGFFETIQKIRVWTPDGGYFDAYVDKFEGLNDE